MRQGSFFVVAHWRGAAIRVHLSALIVGGLLLFAWSAGAVLGLLVVILAHEMGHAVLARRQRLHVVSIDIMGYGGECWTTGWPTVWDRTVFAWGGVLGQLVALSIPGLLHLIGVGPTGRIPRDVLQFLIGPNIVLMVFNLLPVSGLDGGDAWLIVPLAYARARLRRMRRTDDAEGSDKPTLH